MGSFQLIAHMVELWGSCESCASSKCVCLLQLVTACAMQAFHSLFHAKPSTSTLSAELNAQIITVRLIGVWGDWRVTLWKALLGGPALLPCFTSGVAWAKLSWWRMVNLEAERWASVAWEMGTDSCLIRVL